MRINLGEVCTARSSLVDPTADEHKDFPHIAPDSIERDSGRLLDFRSASEDGVTSGKYRFDTGDVLYSKIRPYLNKVAVAGFSGLCSADMYALVVDRGRTTPQFVARLLRSRDFLDYSDSLSNRANIPKLNRKQLMQYEFELPPLKEQRRVTEILDEVDAIRARRRQVLAHLELLTQAIFHEMFGNVTQASPLGELVEEFRYGTSSKATTQGDPVLRIPNVVSGKIDARELKTVSITSAERERLLLRAGDVLLVRSNGNPENVGRCAVFDPSYVIEAGFDGGRFVYASYLIRVRPRPEMLDGKFLAEFLASDDGRRLLKERANTSAGQYNINTASLGTIPIPVVPSEIQKEFAARVEGVDAQRALVRRALDADNELFASLQARAFRGEL